MNHFFKNVFAWGRRHWILLTLLLLLLFLLDTFFFYVFTLFKRINEVAAKWLPAHVADVLAKGLTAYYNWAVHNPWWFVAALILVFPPAGWLVAAWLFLDRFKTSTLTATATSTAETGRFE